MSLPEIMAGTDPLGWAHPLVRQWFYRRFAAPTPAQAAAWPAIAAGQSVLVVAPTGSGKTLAAFLAVIDRLVRQALTGAWAEATRIVYVSPLRALSNDIEKNLRGPLGEIVELAGAQGYLLPPLRVAVRTGDTLMADRRRMLVRPPHILVTTPESLYLLLTAERSRRVLRAAETVIVDEIHAVADDKRGAHLALTLERLEALAGRPLVRVGLSATQKPVEELAAFLVGSGRPRPLVVDTGHRRAMELAVEVPASELGPVASNELWGELYDRLAALARQHRSTLVFVNTRRLAERVAFHLGERLGPEAVAAHHGSLSRRLRLEAERRLKAGQVRVLVATASLELGIDIGAVDLVCQIGSPRSLAVALQRIGRAGHGPGAVARGRLFPTTRDELVECAALVRALQAGELDAIRIPVAPLDVLAQQIVAACAAEPWDEDALFALVRRAWPYRALARGDFDAVVRMLAEGVSAARGRWRALLHRDGVHRRLRARRGARLAALLQAGTIPETALYPVVALPDGAVVGTVDEDFAVESLAGDVFLLGNRSWRIRRVERGRVLVEDAAGAPPSVPFWRGEAPPRTPELSRAVAALRREVAERVPPGCHPVDSPEARATVEWLCRTCGLDAGGATQLVAYIVAGRDALGAVPDERTVVAERFFDESGGMQLVLHAPFGGRLTRAWGLALRKRFCRSFNFELQAAATDNGLVLSLGEQHSFPLADVFAYLRPETVGHLLEQAVLATPLVTTRWRWVASRALLLPRFRGGRRVPVYLQRMMAEDLMAAVFPGAIACAENLPADIPIPDHPLVAETMREILTDALDLEGLRELLAAMAGGELRTVAVETTAASPFAHEILNANAYAFLDDAPLEERRARAVALRRMLPEEQLGPWARLDAGAIERVSVEAWPDVRDADELHDALLSLVALPLMPPAGLRRPLVERLAGALRQWAPLATELTRQDRLFTVEAAGGSFWVAAERLAAFARLHPGASVPAPPVSADDAPASSEEAAALALGGWLAAIGPATAAELAALLGLDSALVAAALTRLEATGRILRGRFSGAGEEWCDRTLLARIHRLTLEHLRQEIQPVPPAVFLRWLLRWQHLAPGTQLSGERGLLEVLGQLQGFEAPASAWERQILARRLADYRPELLDRLCLSGAVGWARLSRREPAAGLRRVVPTSASPVGFFLRAEADWLALVEPPELPAGSSAAARAVYEVLARRGACFFADLVRATGLLKAEVETALWELVAAGCVTADDFDNLRALADPRRRAGQGRARTQRPRHSTGRWSLVSAAEPVERDRALEAACRMLLARYGVVFRELATREDILPPWRELLAVLRRLEARGEVRGGRFVDGFLGEQFALPVAVESLRAEARRPERGETVVVAAADPLNLVGVLVPGERVPAVTGRSVTYRDGVPVHTPVAAAG
jgi:ATP-dependent Lhr-like helicase